MSQSAANTMELNKDDVKNLLVIVGKTTFLGTEAPIILELQQKLTAILNQPENKDQNHESRPTNTGE